MIDFIDKNCGLNDFSAFKRVVFFPFWLLCYVGYLSVFLITGLVAAIYYYFYELHSNRRPAKDL